MIESSTDEEQSMSASFASNRFSTRSQSSFIGAGFDGYLDAERDEFLSGVKGLLHGELKFERKFFSVKRGILYCYKDKSSETSMGSHNLREVIHCGPMEGDDLIFYIQIKQKEGEPKEIKYRADSTDKRDQWIAVITDCMSLPDPKAMVGVSASDFQFYKDQMPIFIDLEELPSLKFVLIKPPEVRASVSGKKGEKVTPTPGNPKQETKTTVRRKSFDITDDAKNFSMIIPSQQQPMGCWGKICISVGSNKKNKVGDQSDDKNLLV